VSGDDEDGFDRRSAGLSAAPAGYLRTEYRNSPAAPPGLAGHWRR
jgi:hypothetical protein